MTQLTQQSQSILALPEVSRSLLADLCQLTKVRITVMVVITAYIGYVLGAGHALPVTGGQWVLFIAMLAGTAISCMGAAVLNQVMEHDTDARMHRTMDRPLPAGRMSVRMATMLGLAISLLGVLILALFTHWLAAAISAFTIVSYVLIYTPMKRRNSLSTIVGAVPGALPPLIGYAAVTGAIAPPPLAVFAIMFMWQLPHFLAIAWLYRDDYARGGFPMLPVIDPTGASTFRQILLGCMALLPVALLPTLIGVSGRAYFAIALIAGVAFLALGVALVAGRTTAHARTLFLASLIYLPVVLVAMVIDRV